jgi:hypothetical protein
MQYFLAAVVRVVIRAHVFGPRMPGLVVRMKKAVRRIALPFRRDSVCDGRFLFVPSSVRWSMLNTCNGGMTRRQRSEPETIGAAAYC